MKLTIELDIAKMLTLSLGHISEKTYKLLDTEPEHPSLPWVIPYESGWMVYIDPDMLADKAGAGDMPHDLKACMKLAQQAECQWLRLEGDEPILAPLTVYSTAHGRGGQPGTCKVEQ